MGLADTTCAEKAFDLRRVLDEEVEASRRLAKRDGKSRRDGPSAASGRLSPSEFAGGLVRSRAGSHFGRGALLRAYAEARPDGDLLTEHYGSVFDRIAKSKRP